MKPAKEKAKELVDKMDMVVGGGNYDAKEYALISISEVLRCALFATDEIYNYYLEVKIEIEKL
jgi:hypothetical protein